MGLLILVHKGYVVDNALKYLIPCFSEIIRFPLTWCLSGIGGIVVVLISDAAFQEKCILLASVELLAFFISWVVKFCVDIRARKKMISFELCSLCPEEKDILRSMLRNSVNCYELKIAHDFDVNAQTKQNALVCRLMSLKDRGVLDLTQTLYDQNNDLLKATMPVMVWELLNKKYKKDPAYFVRISNNIKRPSIKKRLKKVFYKRKKC